DGFIFFFQQKPAYELFTCLEFRRLLFRSGQELKDTLIEALDAARDADAGFLAWARRHRDQGCTGSPTDDPGYRRGMSRSVDAQADRKSRAKGKRVARGGPATSRTIRQRIP